jgi:hypothetical protein
VGDSNIDSHCSSFGRRSGLGPAAFVANSHYTVFLFLVNRKISIVSHSIMYSLNWRFIFIFDVVFGLWACPSVLRFKRFSVLRLKYYQDATRNLTALSL